MAIKWEYWNCEMYGKIRSFKANRCINNEDIRAFNQNRINAAEIVSFDSGLLELEEIKEYNGEDVTEQILLIIVRPDVEKVDENLVYDIETFEFCGYDLVEMQTCISAITNMGAVFEHVIDYKNLNEFGLMSKYLDAVTTQIKLRDNYPYEDHAYCEIVEVWRKLV
ncbi:MAG: hypothetical protein ACERKN_18220 [Velocimicrobium sp.]